MLPPLSSPRSTCAAPGPLSPQPSNQIQQVKRLQSQPPAISDLESERPTLLQSLQIVQSSTGQKMSPSSSARQTLSTNTAALGVDSKSACICVLNSPPQKPRQIEPSRIAVLKSTGKIIKTPVSSLQRPANLPRSRNPISGTSGRVDSN